MHTYKTILHHVEFIQVYSTSLKFRAALKFDFIFLHTSGLFTFTQQEFILLMQKKEDCIIILTENPKDWLRSQQWDLVSSNLPHWCGQANQVISPWGEKSRKVLIQTDFKYVYFRVVEALAKAGICIISSSSLFESMTLDIWQGNIKLFR